MLLKYEKEILEKTNSDASLTILAKGLDKYKTITTLLELYSNENSLAILLNTSTYDMEFFESCKNIQMVDVTKVATDKRCELYKNGGIFSGSPVVLVTDFINHNISVEMISTIILMNAEEVDEDAAISFICYLFRENNKLGLIKAFSDDAIKIRERKIDSMAKILCVNKIFLYPRFHEIVVEDLPEVSAARIFVRQNEFMEEAVLLIEEIMKNIHRNDLTNKETFNYMKLLIHRQRNRDLAMFKRLIALLYNADSLNVFLYFQMMMKDQKRDRVESSWIYSEPPHVLYDVLRDMLKNDIEKTNSGESSFIFDPDAGEFRTDMVSEQSKKRKCVESVSVEEAELMQDENAMSEELDEMSGVFESKGLASFYLVNPKLKKIVELVASNAGKTLCVLVQNGAIKRVLCKALMSISISEKLDVHTHREFKCRMGQPYEVVVLLNPDLSSIRNIECISTSVRVGQVYIMQYRNSIEEQQFLEEIREEKDAFEQIITEWANLPLMSLEQIDMGDDARFEIQVDSREMRSKLPFFLHRSGNDLKVKILDVGDYLLGSTKCIERKSISDFISSLNTGRLYQQTQKLVHFYKKPVLLLEFDGGFPVLGDLDTAENFSSTYISKLCLFLFNFPSIQLIWSNSHINAVRIIRNIQKAVEIEESNASLLDPELLEALLCIPGINNYNVNRISSEYRNLSDLAMSDLARLESVLDGITARKVYDFFRQSLQETVFVDTDRL